MMNCNSGRNYRVVWFDVWGNEKDGFEVNNRYVTDDIVYISDDATRKEILQALYNMRIINTCDMQKLSVDDYSYDSCIEVTFKNGMPLLALETEA